MSKRLSFTLVTILVLIETPLLLYTGWLFGTRDYIVPLLDGFLMIVALVVTSYLALSIFIRSRAAFKITAALLGLPLLIIWLSLLDDLTKGAKIHL